MNDETLFIHVAAEAAASLYKRLDGFTGVPEGFGEKLLKTCENLFQLADDGITVGQFAEALVAKFGPKEN